MLPLNGGKLAFDLLGGTFSVHCTAIQFLNPAAILDYHSIPLGNLLGLLPEFFLVLG